MIIPLRRGPKLQRSVSDDVDLAGGLANNVSVITTGRLPSRRAFAAVSVTRLVPERDRLLICLGAERSSFPVLMRSGRFAVNILGSEHRHVAEHFSEPSGELGEDAFSRGCWHENAAGMTILCNALLTIDCTLEDLLEHRSTALAIGKALSVSTGGYGLPLLRHRDGLTSLETSSRRDDSADWAPIL